MRSKGGRRQCYLCVCVCVVREWDSFGKYLGEMMTLELDLER